MLFVYNSKKAYCQKGEEKGDQTSLKKFHQNYKPSDERNINSLSDDYIKFIAFAHQKINNSGKGIVAIIVNNSFLKGLTHRKMRNELLKDFDKIYVVDLHGNARIGKKYPDCIIRSKRV